MSYIQINGVWLDVEFYHQPHEPQMVDPGVDESFEVEKVKVGGIEISAILSDEFIAEIETKLMETKDE